MLGTLAVSRWLGSSTRPQICGLVRCHNASQHSLQPSFLYFFARTMFRASLALGTMFRASLRRGVFRVSAVRVLPIAPLVGSAAMSKPLVAKLFNHQLNAARVAEQVYSSLDQVSRGGS